jgi:hypothetical protein
MQSFSGVQDDVFIVYLHHRFSAENVEELLGFLVKVSHLVRARRHLFLNHTKAGVFYQVPAIAILSPDVMLGGETADGFHDGTVISTPIAYQGQRHGPGFSSKITPA